MSFDPHSLERLRELGRQLPKELPHPEGSNMNKNFSEKNSKPHNIETEKDPQVLFQELIKASPDGTVPSHLISRLKNLELDQMTNPDKEQSLKQINTSSRKHIKKDLEAQNLYASFKMLLLENEDEI